MRGRRRARGLWGCELWAPAPLAANGNSPGGAAVAWQPRGWRRAGLSAGPGLRGGAARPGEGMDGLGGPCDPRGSVPLHLLALSPSTAPVPGAVPGGAPRCVRGKPDTRVPPQVFIPRVEYRVQFALEWLI